MEKRNRYSVREIENVLDHLVEKETRQFEKVGDVYRGENLIGSALEMRHDPNSFSMRVPAIFDLGDDGHGEHD
jgi:hypothetical protein